MGHLRRRSPPGLGRRLGYRLHASAVAVAAPPAVRADVNSGDRDPGSRDLQTFNALFPRASYFGEIAILGPANLLDFHPYVELHPSDSLTITLEADSFWRQSDRDGVYSPAGALLRSGQQQPGRPCRRASQHPGRVAA